MENVQNLRLVFSQLRPIFLLISYCLILKKKEKDIKLCLQGFKGQQEGRTIFLEGRYDFF